MDNPYVYLDYAASAPLRPCAWQALADYRQKDYSHANPNSLHSQGREVAKVMEQSRKALAQAMGNGFRPQEVIFTSGGTESNNLAVFGLAEGKRQRHPNRSRVLISAIEHDSVLDLVGPLKDRGFQVELLRPDKDGTISCYTLEQALGDDVALVSIMYANNETGAINPIAELSQLAKAAGAQMHTDAIQAFGHVPVAVGVCDAVSVASHKIGGPVGVGALFLRRGALYRNQVFGGGQELGRRPGTQDVAGIVGFVAAAKEVMGELPQTRSQVEARATHVYQRLTSQSSHIIPTTTATASGKLPGVVSIMCDNLDSQTLLLKLDEAGFAVSIGSACASSSLAPSHVLSAMGIPSKLSYGALRISFDERVSLEDLDRFCDALLNIVEN